MIPRPILVAAAGALLLSPPVPAVGQFRELLELIQPAPVPKPKPKTGFRHIRPVPLPSLRPEQAFDDSPSPPERMKDEVAEASPETQPAEPVEEEMADTAAVPLPPMNPRQAAPEGGELMAKAGQQIPRATPDAPPDVVEDRWSNSEIMEALRECVERLGPIVAEVKPIEPIKAGRCGTAAPVKLLRVGTDPRVEISPAATLNCDMALALNEWIETGVQPAAQRLLGTKVVRLRNVTSYSCRNRNSAARGPLSEHAFANALDIASFFTEDGRLVDLTQHWGPTERELEAARRAAEAERKAAAEAAREATQKAVEAGEENTSASEDEQGSAEIEEIPLPPLRDEASVPAPTISDATTSEPVPKPNSEAEGAFLRAVHEDACGIFGTVLGPEANALHEDHFHLDMKARRRSAFCE